MAEDEGEEGEVGDGVAGEVETLNRVQLFAERADVEDFDFVALEVDVVERWQFR